MNEIKGLLIGGALVACYVWWTRRGARPDGRGSSSLDGSTPAASWRGASNQFSNWSRTCAPSNPPGGGLGRLRVHGYGG